MGVTAMIPDATIGQLLAEATSRWGAIWDPAATRTRVLMMMPRKERKLYEMHGDMVEHGQPVMSMFHRPRAEAPLLQEQGLDPRQASFLFVDLASSDLGPWLQRERVGCAAPSTSTPFRSPWACQTNGASKRSGCCCSVTPICPPSTAITCPFPWPPWPENAT